MATQEPGQQTSLTALPRLEDLPKSGDGYDIMGPAGKAAHWKL